MTDQMPTAQRMSCVLKPACLGWQFLFMTPPRVLAFVEQQYAANLKKPLANGSIFQPGCYRGFTRRNCLSLPLTDAGPGSATDRAAPPTARTRTPAEDPAVSVPRRNSDSAYSA